MTTKALTWWRSRWTTCIFLSSGHVDEGRFAVEMLCELESGPYRGITSSCWRANKTYYITRYISIVWCHLWERSEESRIEFRTLLPSPIVPKLSSVSTAGRLCVLSLSLGVSPMWSCHLCYYGNNTLKKNSWNWPNLNNWLRLFIQPLMSTRIPITESLS